MQKATLRVRSISKLDVQADNNTVLDVTVQLYEEENLLEEKRLSYPLDTTDEQLKEELQKFLDNYNLEREQAAANAEHEAAQKTADETIEKMTGFAIGDAPENSVKEAIADATSSEPVETEEAVIPVETEEADAADAESEEVKKTGEEEEK